MNREQLLQSLRNSGTPADVLQAMATVARDRFVPPTSAAHAWDDAAIYLARGSTISQPAMVAVVLQELQLSPGLQVLEVGSGSGYLLALLAAMGIQATGIEIDQDLAQSSQEVLGGIARVICGNADTADRGGPFDRIVFSASLIDVPLWARESLSTAGFVLAPIGPDIQELTRVYADGSQVKTGRLCRFVRYQSESLGPNG